MSTRSHNLTQRCERAAKAYLLGLRSDTTIAWCDALNIRRGIENRDTADNEGQESSLKNLPLILVAGQPAEPILPFNGRWNVQLEVSLHTAARDTTDDQQEDMAGELFDLFCTDSIANDLSQSIPEFYVGRVIQGLSGYRIEDGKWILFATYNLNSCCAVAML